MNEAKKAACVGLDLLLVFTMHEQGVKRDCLAFLAHTISDQQQ